MDFAERQKLIDGRQNGFRQRRGWLDSICSLKQFSKKLYGLGENILQD